ncbi:MAG TPA: MurR/RpiR family transcriptional regulator [Burkholderiales bacterium]|nr:MurR/RpiR family transcriptional regulator [Burkholderiales bacterium]
MSAATPLLRRLNEGANDFSKNQRVLARYVLANYQSVAFATVAQLATQSGVSEATIVRFAQALDFSGYPELQKEIRRLVRAELRGVDRFKRGTDRKAPAHTPLDLIAEKERENISALYDAFDPQAFAKALAMLRAASEVVVIGTRSTAPLAHHLWFALTKIAVDATHVTTISSETYDYLNRVDKQASVVVIGFPRYLREQVDVLEFAKRRKLATLTITDSTFSPLRGQVSLYVPAESASFVAFHCAPLVLINALVHELSVTDEKKTLAALDRFEAVADSQQYFLKE